MKNIFTTIIFFFCTIKTFATCIDSEFVLAATGDTIFHGSLYVQAFKDNPQGDFKPLWEKTMPYLQQADLMYTNIEGPVAPGLFSNGKVDQSLAETYHPTNRMYSLGEAGKSYTFNFHPGSIRALAEEGFDLFSLANNHSLDRRLLGVDLTLDFLNTIDVIHFGTKLNGAPNESYISYLQYGSYSISFISCTYGNNTNIKNNQVLNCYKKGQPNPKLLELVSIANQSSDAVIVTPHWGNEYSPNPSQHQRRLAKAMVQEGVTAIIGHHPHVIQPIEFITNSNSVSVPIIYSLGNFVSNQAPSNWRDQNKNESRFKRRVGATAFLGFSKVNGHLQVNQIKFLPTYMKIVHEGKKRGMRTLLPAYSELYGTDKTLKASLAKAQKHFLKSIDSQYMYSAEDLMGGLVCQ